MESTDYDNGEVGRVRTTFFSVCFRQGKVYLHLKQGEAKGQTRISHLLFFSF